MSDTSKIAAWYVPTPSEGGGGFRTILQNAQALAAFGFNSHFYVVPSTGACIDLSIIKKSCQEWFGMSPDVWFIAGDDELPRDCSIATAWNTVEYVTASDHKVPAFYFVQDYEPWFYPMGSEYLSALHTYRQGLSVVTIGRWLAHTINEAYGNVVGYIDFGTSPMYSTANINAAREHAICAIYQPEKPRRATTLLLDAIEVLLKLDRSLKVYLYGSNAAVPLKNSRLEQLGLITPQECCDLYKRCECGISLGSSNPSRIPFEMMACGLPVVDLYLDNNLYDFSDDCIVLAEATPASLADAVLGLLEDTHRRNDLSSAGLSFISKRSQDRESQQFANIVVSSFKQKEPLKLDLSKTYRTAPVVASPEKQDIYRSIIQARHKQLTAACKPIALEGKTVSIACRPDEDVKAVKLALWSVADQSDLRWIDMDYVDGISSAIVDIVPADMSGHCEYHLHFYAVSPDGQQTILDGMIVAFTYSKENARSKGIFDLLQCSVEVSSVSSSLFGYLKSRLRS